MTCRLALLAALLSVSPCLAQFQTTTAIAPGAGTGSVGAAGAANRPNLTTAGPQTTLKLGSTLSGAPLVTATVKRIPQRRAESGPTKSPSLDPSPRASALSASGRSPLEPAGQEQVGKVGMPTAETRAAATGDSQTPLATIRTPAAALAIDDLSAFYDRAGRLPQTSEVHSTGASERESDLARADPSKPEALSEPPAPSAPRSSLSRTAKIGYVTSWLMMAYNFGFPLLADAFGLASSPTYEPPQLPSTTLAGAMALGLFLSAMAPVAEEALFRGAVMTWTRRKFGHLRAIGSFWLGALASALIFVPLHERVDPVTIAVYAAISLTLSRVYYKEGILASMAGHAVYNTFLGSLMLAGLFGISLAFPGLIILVVGLPLLVVALRDLRRERPDRASGRVVAFALTPGLSLALSASLLAGTAVVGILGGWMLALGGGVFWIMGALALYVRSRRAA